MRRLALALAMLAAFAAGTALAEGNVIRPQCWDENVNGEVHRHCDVNRPDTPHAAPASPPPNAIVRTLPPSGSYWAGRPPGLPPPPPVYYAPPIEPPIYSYVYPPAYGYAPAYGYGYGFYYGDSDYWACGNYVYPPGYGGSDSYYAACGYPPGWPW